MDTRNARWVSPLPITGVFFASCREYILYTLNIYIHNFFFPCVSYTSGHLLADVATQYVLPIHVIPLSLSMMGAGRLKMERGCAFRTVIKVFSLRKNVGRRRDLAAGERISFETLDSYFKKREKKVFFLHPHPLIRRKFSPRATWFDQMAAKTNKQRDGLGRGERVDGHTVNYYRWQLTDVAQATLQWEVMYMYIYSACVYQSVTV